MSITTLHDKAMELSDRAIIAKLRGDFVGFEKLSKKALELEIKAVDSIKFDFDLEPTRTILLRSAASIAVDCSEFRTAEQLIATALMGNPPNELAEELRDLLEQSHFKRHLRLKDIHLSTSQIQLSITGSEVGYGVTLSDIFVDRITDLGKLLYRTVERLSGRSYRSGGGVPRSISDSYNLYMSAPRAQSFSVTLQVGRQMQIPGIDLSDRAIDEVMNGFSLINSGMTHELEQQIEDRSYFLNFVGLAKRIAPDGEKVNMVGLTTFRENQEIGVALTRKQAEISPPPSETQTSQITKDIVEVTGRLLFADGRKARRRIELVDDQEKRHVIDVPEGMMDDIVKPLWDEFVTVRGHLYGRVIHLVDISRVSSD